MKSKYSAEEKFQIVIEAFTGNVTQVEICSRHCIYSVQLIKWKEQFMGEESRGLLIEEIPLQGSIRSRI